MRLRPALLRRAGLMIVGAIFFLLLSLAMGNAQPLQIEVSTIPVARLSPADIDFEHSSGTNLLFTISIRNTSPLTVSAKLQGDLHVNLADGSFDREGATFTSKPFDVPTGVKTITNIDVSRGGSIGTEKFTIDPDFKGRVNDALASGMLPAGVYTFDITLIDVNGSPVSDQKDVVLTLENSSRVELRSPRDGASTNEFPLFEFFREGSGRAILRVAEKTADLSREDALARRPLMLEADVAGNSFFYSGGRPLESGKTYVWQVIVEQLLTGGATSQISSSIWEFTVSSSGGDNTFSVVVSQLEEIFGQRYLGIFTQIRENGFSPAGRITLNGSTISQSELLNLLIQLRDNADSAELSFE